MNILLTRPRAQSQRFAVQLRDAGVQAPITTAPLLEIEAVPFDSVPLRNIAGVIFTSENGVAGYVAGGGRCDLPAWCVGPVTVAAARNAGFVPVVDGGGDAVALSRMLCAQRPDGPLCHARGSHVAADLATSLTAAGLQVTEATVYAQHATPLSRDACALLSSAGPVIVPVFSPRTARLLAQGWAALAQPRASVTAIAISPAAAAPLQSCGFGQVVTAPTPNGAAILAHVLSALGLPVNDVTQR
ncbi:uroporphyrinogen-III synthase [Roseicitreum antarcticum]|uniref:Uroporphyrinogen-III synthase n=1 Tax=Roseicitreum antarcticum TaxID=564137 RepID=A0A1H2RN39_9RHOB|nr:uroporphyrinogen-III synthase [Roseicitreum antarcticum]SDW20903.1 uroporphyrinogen-III synthase [Roseicitreum antarcticum]